MEFRRITSLPPYVFTIIDTLKIEARRAGVDVIDLGFGNPDFPSPDVAVEKLAEAVHNPRNHRYSSSKGIPKLRQAVADLYLRRFGVELDPDTEVINTIGAKEGFSHLMWTLLQPGDAALVPSPSYPIHIYGPLLAGADIREVPLGTGTDFFESLTEAWNYSWPKPRVIVMSFPHNPTTTCVDLDFMQQVVDFAREHEVVVVHDNAYAEIGFDGYVPPSILQAEGAKEVAVELYSMTKSFSMAGWRVAFLAGNREVVAALDQAQELPRLRHLPAHPDRGHRDPQRGARLPEGGQRDVPGPARHAVRRTQPHRLAGRAARWARCSSGRRSPSPTARWAPSTSPRYLVREAQVAVSPGVGLRSRRRRPRPLRPHRERAAHQPGHPQPAAGADQARLTAAHRGGRAGDPGPGSGGRDEGGHQQAFEAERDGRVGHLVPGPALLLHAAPDQVGGHAQDGLGR